MSKRKRKQNMIPFYTLIAVIAIIIVVVIAFFCLRGCKKPSLESQNEANATTQNSEAVTTKATDKKITAATTTVSTAKNDENSNDNEITSAASNEKATNAYKSVPQSGSITMKKSQLGIGQQILVNNDHKYDSSQDTDFVLMTEYSSLYKTTFSDLDADRFTVNEFNRMLTAFKSVYPNTTLSICSGYRTIATQKRNFDASVASVGEEETLKWYTRPGYSEHHTGYAIDFNTNSYGDAAFTGKGNQAWISENCHKYGFILRYTADKKDITGVNPEPWHFRQVGVPHADYIMKNGICYEEYIELLQDYSYDNPLTVSPDAGGTYYIYYVKLSGDSAKIPLTGYSKYSCSGNNEDGFIVTATK